MENLFFRRHFTEPRNTVLAVDAWLLKITYELSERRTGGGVRQRRGFEVFRDEQFVSDLLVYGLWNLVAGGVVLLYQETALLRLSEVPNIEDGKSFEQVFEPWAKMRVLVGGVQRAKRRVSVLPLVRQIDGPRIDNQ